MKQPRLAGLQVNMKIQARMAIGFVVVCALIAAGGASAQRAPSPAEESAYAGLHAAASRGDVAEIERLAAIGGDLEVRDSGGRTALLVAAFKSHDQAVKALVKAGADPNAYDNQAYDVITIAAVADDPDMVSLAISLGGNPGNITSPYDGTALIAAAHLGHVRVVRTLIAASAPLDHVNNLGWTALIEAVVLGDGGPRHVEVARALIEAGADTGIADRQGVTPLEHARQRGYEAMVALFPDTQN